ncbi:hypothetical protein [Promineifilum sp.]|uniref:hypothetical protein n=1 Tax=Promineifilum sp. TaxID=2664178 RepID=UPI0035AFE272
MRPSARLLLLAAAILTVVYLIGLAFNVSPWLRGPEEWRWPYVIPGSVGRAWLSALVLAGYLLLIAALTRRPEGDSAHPRRRTTLILLAAGLMTPLLQIALLYLDHADLGFAQLFNRTVSELSGGFYNVGVMVTDNRDFLAHFVERMPSYPVHPQRHPPGVPLLFAWARQLFDRLPALAAGLSERLRPAQCHNLALMNLPDSAIAAAVVQMLVPLGLGIIVAPLYVFGRAVYGRSAARRAVLLWPLLPSVALWATRWNQFYALITLLVFLPFAWGLTRRRLWPLFVAGMLVALGTFLSLGNVVLGLFLGWYALVWLLDQAERPPLVWLLAGAALFAGGFALFWLALWLGYGLNPVALWRTALSTHLGLGRNYVSWLFYHLYDFLVFLGIPLAVFGAARFARAGWRWRVRPRDVLALSFGIGLLLLDISGTSQGEVARVWAFLLPLALLAAVPRAERNRAAFLGIAALLALQVFVANLFLQPVSTGLTDPPAPPPAVQPTAGPLAVWQNGIILHEVRLPAAAAPGETVTVELIWGAERSIGVPYTVFVHVLDASGQLVAQTDGLPRGGAWLTTCWQPGHTFADAHAVSLPADLPPGEYTLDAGLYWLPTGERALLRDGMMADSVRLGALMVAP